MSRTSVAAVSALLRPKTQDGDYDETTDLQQFVDTAAILVDRVATCAVSRGTPLSTGELEMVERWLSAHFYVQSDQALASKATAGSSGSFQGQYAMYLENSKYGQTAMAIDSSGCLAAIAAGSDRRVASLTWLGKTESERIDYEDRN